MKTSGVYNLKRTLKPGQRREPLRTLAELAEEFGIPHKSLMGYFAQFQDGPKPVFQSTRAHAGSGPHHYYRPSEVRAWWQAKLDSGRVHLKEKKKS